MKHTFKLSIDCANAAFCEDDTPTPCANTPPTSFLESDAMIDLSKLDPSDAEAEYHDADETNLGKPNDALNEAREAFRSYGRSENFSYLGLKVLFDYFEDCEDEDDKIEAVRGYLNENTQLVGETSTGFIYAIF